MYNKLKIPCKRCLIREIGQEDAWKSIQAYQKGIPAEKKTDASEYEQRLAVCKDCKWLHRGMCQKNGYYVEAKAYAKDNHCPLGDKMW